jgi:hypothetical protein
MLIRGHHDLDDQFTQVPNSWLRDSRLSLGAIGLLGQLLSHRPGWSVSLESLAHSNNCGRDRIRTYVGELSEAGYLTRSKKQRRNSKGHVTGYDYHLGSPSLDYPTKADPTKGEPTKENSAHKNTRVKNTISKNTIDEEVSIEFDQFWDVYPKKVDKPLAKKSFQKALVRATFEDILKGAQAYADDPNREQRFTKNPSTWLNADAWENPPLPAKGKRAETKRLIDEWKQSGA